MNAAAAVAALPDGAVPVEVLGAGPLGDEVRRLLGDRARLSGTDVTPEAIVDTTGELGALNEALARVATLGTVVLAGPAPDRPVPMDLYAHIHLRGLRVVGVSPLPAPS